jgi:GT2 family glycosyltransferase
MVDNASSDQSVDFVEQNFSPGQIRLIKNPENNYSKGLNLAAKEAKGDFIAYFNNDIEVDPFYLKEIIPVFIQNSRVGLAQGKLLHFYDRKTIDSIGETMDLFGNPFTIGGGKSDFLLNEPLEILSASGSACVCRKTVLEDVGYYDERYHIFYEDMDLALRIRSRGYSILHLPLAIAYHIRAKTDLSPELRAENKYHFNKNRIATMVKNYDLLSLLIALPTVALLYGLALVIESSEDRRLVIGRLKSGVWNLRALGYLLTMRRTIFKTTIVRFPKYRRLMYHRRILELLVSFRRNLAN